MGRSKGLLGFGNRGLFSKAQSGWGIKPGAGWGRGFSEGTAVQRLQAAGAGL